MYIFGLCTRLTLSLCVKQHSPLLLPRDTLNSHRPSPCATSTTPLAWLRLRHSPADVSRLCCGMLLFDLCVRLAVQHSPMLEHHGSLKHPSPHPPPPVRSLQVFARCTHVACRCLPDARRCCPCPVQPSDDTAQPHHEASGLRTMVCCTLPSSPPPPPPLRLRFLTHALQVFARCCC
jgi:hypothetical protein